VIVQCQAVITQHEKRQRQFDKLVDEWKRKVLDVQTELDNCQKESRSNAADAYKCKTQLDENREVIDALRRENKNLSGLQPSCQLCASFVQSCIELLRVLPSLL